jgi:hypothetical protein
MKHRFALGLLFVALSSLSACAVLSLFSGSTAMDFLGWTNAYKLTNGEVELVVVPKIGGRIMGYNFVGGTNVVDINPANKGKEIAFNPPKQVVYYGGAKMWSAPQSEWSWPPIAYWENAPHHIAQFGPHRLQMAGPDDAASMVKFTRDICLAPTGSTATLHHYMDNVTSTQRQCAIWAINPAPLPALLLAPVGSSNWGDTAQYQTTNGVMYYQANPGSGGKIFVVTNRPWVAALQGTNLWVNWGEPPASMTFARNEAPVEIWHGSVSGHAFVELELQGPLETLAPGAKASYTMYWALARTDGTGIDAALAALKELGLIE